jgi:hypothetical protein
MKKLEKVFLAGSLALAMFGIVLTGCGNTAGSDNGNTEQAVETEQPAEAANITVTFMEGETTLGTVETAAGVALDASAYSAFEAKEDYEFLGWYETPSFLESSKKDPSVDTFTEDTTLFGNYKKAVVTEDTRLWYLAGTSQVGPMKDNNWAGDISDELKESFQLKPTGNATNEFQITIDLFEGDQFQVIHDWSWDGQKGFGWFTDLDETQMESGGSLGGSAKTANVNVLVSGNYTITLTTDPDNAALDTLVVVRNGDPLTEGEAVEEEPFEVTDATNVKAKGSWVADWSEWRELERVDGTNTFTVTMDLDADVELGFSVFQGDEDTGIFLKEENVSDDASKAIIAETGNNIKTTEAGSYTFTVNLDDMSVTVAK